MRSFRGLLALVFCVGLVALAILNPQMDDFENFAAEHLRAQLADRLEERLGGESSVLGRALAGAGVDLASQYIDRLATRENYVIASTYTVDIDGPRADRLEWRFLGVAGRFIPIDAPQQDEGNADDTADRQPQ